MASKGQKFNKYSDEQTINLKLALSMIKKLV